MSGTPRTLVQVPAGVQCFVGPEARRRRAIEARVLAVFDGWDYEEIIPPLLDYADVFASRELRPRTYSFVGRDGTHLALRPDFTSLLAKIAAGRLADRLPPIRLRYSGEVLRWEPPRAGAQSELHQMGLEHLGGDRLAADVEVLAVAAEALDAAGARDWVLTVGHVGVFGALCAGAEEPLLDVLRERVEAKDALGTREAARALGLPAGSVEGLARLCSLAGGPEVLDEAKAALGDQPALAELQAVTAALRHAGLGSRIAVDLGEVRGLDYYTGLVFRVYARGLGFELGAGGRYDGLLARFGRPLPAVGFMFGLDRLTRLLEQQDRLPADVVAAPIVVGGGAVGERVQRARGLRAAGRRVRLDDGEGAAS
jgi:ATP phosphoribosyltransferase regulatory subunit